MTTNKSLIAITALVLLAALSRLIPHPPNFAPVAAMALFAGAHIWDKRIAFAMPLVAMLIGDLFLGWHSGLLLVYVCMCISVAIGVALRGRIKPGTIALGAVASSVIFFTVTNFGVWLAFGLYPTTASGLVACYVAAIPFFHYTLLGDLFYAGVLFGGFALLQNWRPALRPVAQ